jgi:hypothetical protein
MKTLLISLFSIMMLASCSKTSVNPDDDGKSKISGSMKATLDGKAWTAKTLAFGGLGITQVNGKIDEVNFVSFEFSDVDLKLNQSYPLGDYNDITILQTLLVMIDEKTYLPKSGSLKITKYSKGKSVTGEANAVLYSPETSEKEIKLENCTFTMSYN